MSSLLEQAILDAKDLKEAAIKNAQQAIIEKYSDEFEGEIEKLLEQAAPPTDPMAAPPMAATPGMPGAAPVAGAAPVDPEKAKNDGDNKSDIFDKVQYAFSDGEVMGGKVHTTGVIEIDLDSLTKFSFHDNQKTPEQMALQELKALSKKTLNEELDEEMNDDDDYDDESETFPYEDDDSDTDDDVEDDIDDTEDDIDMDDEDFEDDDMDDMDDLDLDVDIDDEDGTEEDIDDEDLEDVDMDDDDLDMDMDDELDDDSDEDLYDDDDDDDESEFEIDFETDPDDADYDPDADVDTDMDDEESDEEDSEDDEEDMEDDEEEYDDEEDSEEEDDEDEEDESLEESDFLANFLGYKRQKEKEESGKGSKHIKHDKDEKPSRDLPTTIKTKKRMEREKRMGLEEAIKLDYKRTGPRSKWTGMFHEEAEHDVALANLQLQIEELEQEVDQLEDMNKNFRAGLKESVKLIEKITAENKSYVVKINQYEKKLHESRLLNYKLLYTNKALSDASLNERQKNKLAESINGAKTAEEVKLLYETLKSTMRDGTSSGRSPKSLSEAVERRSSSLLLRASRAEAPKQNDYAERMKKLAGLT